MSASAFLRRAATITTVTAVALSTALIGGSAHAQDADAANAVVTNAVISPGDSEEGDQVVIEYRDGQIATLGTELIGLRTDDDVPLKTYCVEISTAVRGDAEMEEREWDDHPNSETRFHANRAHILWILQNAYPVIAPEELATAAELADPGELSRSEAIAATQAAIWHFSDDAALAGDNGDDVVAVYAYLTSDENVGIEDAPTPALSVTPESLEGVAGEAFKPFVVSTTADAVDLAVELPEDVTLSVDGSADGEQVITDGSELVFDVAEDAEAGAFEFGLSADAELNVGRLFVGADYEDRRTQSLILASSEATHLEVTAELTWESAPVQETPTPTPTPEETPEESPTPAPEAPEETPEATPSPAPDDSETPSPAPEETDTPEGGLPDTGVSLSGVAGAALLLLGAGAFVVTRRRAIAER